MNPVKPALPPRRWPYYVVALAFVGICYYVGWVGKDVLVLPSLTVAFVCVALANLDRFKSFKAGGIEAVLRDAQVAVQESRDLALVTSKMLLALVKRTGRFGTFPTAQQREIQETVGRVLSQFNVSDTEKQEVFKEWDAFEKLDYVFWILGGNTVPNFQTDSGVGQKEWNDLRDRTGNFDLPTPEELLAFLERYKFLNAERREIVDDYRYFIANRKHRRPAMWEQRDEENTRKLRLGAEFDK
jgi:hypothetical protein